MFPVCSGQGYHKPSHNYSGGISTFYFWNLQGLLHTTCDIVHFKDYRGREREETSHLFTCIRVAMETKCGLHLKHCALLSFSSSPFYYLSLPPFPLSMVHKHQFPLQVVSSIRCSLLFLSFGTLALSSLEPIFLFPFLSSSCLESFALSFADHLSLQQSLSLFFSQLPWRWAGGVCVSESE